MRCSLFRSESLVLVLVCLAAWTVVAQQGVVAPTAVPNLINFTGTIKDQGGKPLSGVTGVTFLLYREQQGGAPLWTETQNVQADARGNYSVQLGATKSEGLPLELFTSGEARWLGVRVNNGEEQTRVLLLSVPYALKAADAQTLGGLPASAFALAGAANSSAAPATANETSIRASAAVPPSPASTVTTAGGTANALPLFKTATDIENSVITQTGTGAAAKIGIGTSTPTSKLDVKGSSTMEGALTLPAMAAATAAGGKPSYSQNLLASSFNSATATAVNQTFRWQAEPAANNTAAPSATLNLLFGGGGAVAETGLKISSNGQFTFAAGQTFPGTGKGTVTSVGLTAPASDFTVSGSPVTSTGSLGLNWVVAPTNAATANAIVKRDASGGFNSGPIFATDPLGSSSAVYGHSISFGIVGDSPSNIGVYGTSATGAGVGGKATTSGDGVVGYSKLGRGVSGNAAQGQGVMGESFGTTTTVNGFGPDGVDGIAHNALGSGVAGFNYVAGGTGVYGHGDWGFFTNDNVHQNSAAGGWVKATAFVNGYTAPYTIVHCFNSTLAGAAASTPPCGFTLTEIVLGVWILDFGFAVNDRPISLTATNVPPNNPVGDPGINLINSCTADVVFPGGGASTCGSTLTQSQARIITTDLSGNPRGGYFYLVVY